MRDAMAAVVEETGFTTLLDDLRSRVSRITRLHRQGALAGVRDELHDLKRAAHIAHFNAVEDLAHVLEAEIAATGVAAPVGVYMDCMDDAIACGLVGQRAAEPMFAAIRARMLS